MLFSESRFTPLSYDIKNQMKKLINIFVNNNITRRGKLSNLTLDEAKKNVKMMISRTKYKTLHIGNIHLGKQLNKEIPVFIKETGSGGSYIEEDDYNYEHIIIAFDTIFENLEHILSLLAHELIHAIQEYKKASSAYYDATIKMANSEELSYDEWFTYYTEPAEFEANASQLAYLITSFYERKDVDKSKVIHLLDYVLKFPKSKMDEFFNTFLNSKSEDAEIYISYLREMFLSKLHFLRVIADPPDNTTANIKKSDRYWKQFKQKLFTLVQNLKKRQLNRREKNK
jgi:hypothetical protein